MSNTDPFSIKPVEAARHPETAAGSGSSGIIGIANIPVTSAVSASTEAEGLAIARKVIGSQPHLDSVEAFRAAVGIDSGTNNPQLLQDNQMIRG